MPRSPSPPPLPDTPAKWLANFRYRLISPDGERLSPESLGYQLGVSGATVRRWEAGRSNPSKEDLHRFADVCHLTAPQREFLQRIYGLETAAEPVADEVFKREINRVLSLPRPAYLVDELFYIRAWNSYFLEFVQELTHLLPGGMHIIQLATQIGQIEDPKQEWDRLHKVIQSLWMWTARLASYPAYSRMVQELINRDSLAGHWQALIDERADPPAPLVMPQTQRLVDDAVYTVYQSEVFFPPLYRAFIYEPQNQKAREIVQGFIDRAPSEVHFARCLHWSNPGS